MSEESLNILAVVGSLNAQSATRAVLEHTADILKSAGAHIDILDLKQEPLALFDPDTCRDQPGYPALRERVRQADVFLIGTPDYHGAPSGTVKNFLDYFWHEFAGKLFVPLVASHEKGLTVIDQLRTVARQCYAWTLPYGVSFTDKVDVNGGKVISESLGKRLTMLARDARVYGQLLARQRRADLGCEDNCFMAKHR